MTIMGANKEIFGQTDDGQSVYRVTLNGGGLTANVLTWGAAGIVMLCPSGNPSLLGVLARLLARQCGHI